MELTESLPKLSEDKIWEIVASCCATLSAIGPEFEVSMADFERGDLYEATGLQGQTGLGARGDQFIQVLKFNVNLFREGLEDAYLNTVYHELLHVIVNKYMIKNGFIKVINNNQFQVINKEEFNKIQDDNGHGGRWLELAIRANKVLGLAIPITPYCSEREFNAVYNASIEDGQEAAFEIRCQDCGIGNKYLVINPEELPELKFLLMLYFDTKNKNKNSVCKKCGGTVYIIIRDAAFKAFLDKRLEELTGLIQMMKMFGIARA